MFIVSTPHNDEIHHELPLGASEPNAVYVQHGHAITQDAKEAARILTLFKRMLPKNLAALEM
jgi:hypothetical protein